MLVYLQTAVISLLIFIPLLLAALFASQLAEWARHGRAPREQRALLVTLVKLCAGLVAALALIYLLAS